MINITIITVVYNDFNNIENTIKSVLNQTYENLEYIIIDGGSTDGTIDIIKKYEDRIDYWVSESDDGIYFAMNKGIDVASGEWINFMNAGDIFFNNDVLENTFMNGCYLEEIVVHGKVALSYQNDLIAYYGNSKIIPHQGAFFKTQMMKLLKFDTSYKIFADGECLIRMQQLDGYKAKFLDTVIANFELGGIGNHPKYFFQRLKEEIKIKKDKKQKISFKWYVLKVVNFLGFLFYKIFGEKFYYTLFEKQLLKLIK